jgi:hypothetical protein
MVKLSSLLLESKKNKSEKKQTTKVSEKEARWVYDYFDYDFDFKEFLMGMNVEMEHQDLTGGSLVQTGMIAAAHLREVPNYYTLLKRYVEK